MLTNTKNGFRFALLITALLTAGSAFAQDDSMPSTTSMTSETSMDGNASDIPVFSGGIGDDEISYIHSVQSQYDTKLLFTQANGMFLSDLNVTIRNKHGDTVVNTVTKGPVLLVNLPIGTYSVTASQGDTSREQKISVTGHSLHTIQFRFPTVDTISSEND